MKLFASIALAVATLASTGAHAVDTFDIPTKLLTLQSVSTGGRTYQNAVVTVGSFSQLTVSGGSPAGDTFDPTTNFLTLGGVIAGGQAYTNVRVHIDSYTLNSVGTTPASAANSVPIIVDSGPTGNSANVLFASVKVCKPGSQAQCQTIDHLLLDTGSTGLRVLSNVLSPFLGLSAANGPTGLPLLNCAQFLDTSFTWGPIVNADVGLGNYTAANLPIQVIADPKYNALSASCGTGVANDTISALGAKGILGIGLFQQDCGSGCANRTNNGVYFTCSTSACQKAVATTASLSQQLQNPVAAFGTDNNGILIDLPAVPWGGAPTAAGFMYFGIGTQSNNALGGATVLTTNGNGYITTSFEGKNLTTSFIDSGSNGVYFDSASIAKCTNSNLSGFDCPAAVTAFAAINVGSNGANTPLTFEIDDASKQFSNFANSAFPLLGGPVNDAQTFDWGLPFFLGRRVFIGFENKPTGSVLGPFFAY